MFTHTCDELLSSGKDVDGRMESLVICMCGITHNDRIYFSE